MIETLPLFHKIAGQPVVVLGEGEAAQAKRRLVERAGGVVLTDIQQGIDEGARLAFIAHDNPEAASGDAIRLRCAGLLVNVTDQPDLCDFVVPSVLDRSPVLIAVGTGGASAGLAKALRLRLENLLPQGLGRLASALLEARGAVRARWSDAGARRRALDAALAENGALDPLREGSVEAVAGWLEGGEALSGDVMVEIQLASCDPDDLTLRQARLLGMADVVAHEPGVAKQILDRARADAVRIALPPGEPAPARPGLTVVLRATSS
ncbi:MAG: siroheme synthase [Alphaproteobacteria bacterium]|nr:siroheme synthase [Alphaproteobacteria bacterium]